MYNNFTILGVLEENFNSHEYAKLTIKVRTASAPHLHNMQVLPVNIVRVSHYMDDIMLKGDMLMISGRIELDNKGNIELLAERLIIVRKNEESS